MFFIIKGIRILLKALCAGSAQQEPSEQQQQQQQWRPQQQQAQYPPVQQPAPVYPPSQPPIQQPHKPQQHSSSPYPHSPRPDQNQANQHDPHYMDLRKRANEEGDAMARCFQQSHEAYARGDGAGAKELSNQGKEHQQKMEKLNKQASDWIYVENNKVHTFMLLPH
ncbi:hypothetical protein J3R30DRAFT_1683465 [Lentinula aciculospora]|uniref:DUF1771 domain-containing protein n=1 Tax=Lentinula aciculospora TaxID=153920 RepID=A0A9W8ZXE5_9AGAR|nr:hypothetical protein J3R30DRAFT_1683465 [Lentinula aciculospora]